ncbi:MAG: RNA polymerase sigma factor [Salibacteraceae bacterium]
MDNIKAETDENLVVRIAQGDKKAFDEIYARYNKPLFSFYMKMLSRDREKCEDFLQDLFMILIEKPHYFDSTRRFKPWLYSIAHNMIKNEYKKLEVRKVMDKNAETEFVKSNLSSPENLTQDALFSNKLDLLLAKIDPEVKEAFLLKYKVGFQIDEIAKMMNVKEGTIKSRLFYVKKYLSQNLAEFKPNA